MTEKIWNFLPTGEIEFKGIIYPGSKWQNKKVIFNSERWFTYWKGLIKEIKTLKLESNQRRDIYESYVRDILTYSAIPQMINKHQQINEISTELKLALDIAYSNYRDSKKGFWGFTAGIFANKLFEKLPVPNLNYKKL